MRTGGSGVETKRTRELRGLCEGGGNREKEAILTKKRARQAVSSYSG